MVQGGPLPEIFRAPAARPKRSCTRPRIDVVTGRRPAARLILDALVQVVEVRERACRTMHLVGGCQSTPSLDVDVSRPELVPHVAGPDTAEQFPRACEVRLRNACVSALGM